MLYNYTPVSLISLLLALVILTTPTLGSCIEQTSLNLSSTGQLLKQSAEKRYHKQRLLFQQALKALENNKPKELKRLKKSLKRYPLLPYLTYQELMRSIDTQKSKTIHRFIKQNPNFSYNSELRDAWLNSLAAEKRWKSFLQFYTSSKNTNLKCHYTTALSKKKKTRKQAYSILRDLWLEGKPLPKSCKSILEQWQKSRSFTHNLYWERAKKALPKKHFTLAKSMAKKASPAKERKAKLWITTYKKPLKLKKRQSYQIKSEFDQNMVLMGLKRYIKQDMETFNDVWNQYAASLTYNNTEKQDLLHYIARWYSWHYDYRAWSWLAKADPKLNDKELMERRVRMALKTQNWRGVLKWISAMPIKQSNDEMWRYWKARAELALLKQDSLKFINRPHTEFYNYQFVQIEQDLTYLHQNITALLNNSALPPSNTVNSHQERLENIRKAFYKLSTQRSYYGFLASSILQKPLSLNVQRSHYSPEQLLEFQSNSLVSHAVEWHLLNKTSLAKKTWRSMIRQLSRGERALAANIAYEWGWFNQAIVAAASSSQRNDLTLRFPLAFATPLLKATKNSNVTPEWAFALIRQESAYQPKANSRAGAKGLMQLMPATARQVAKQANKQIKTPNSLLNPELNIQLGVHYLNSLAKQFDGNSLLATAGYNAGPRRSREWRPTEHPLSGDIWIETIPIRETREYVKNIATYQPIYRSHLGLSVELPPSIQMVSPKITETTK